MNKTAKRNAKLLLLVIVIAGIGLLFLDYDSAVADGVSFSIPVPDEMLSFAGQTASNSNASILCSVKQTTYAIDSTGIVLTTVNSKLLQGNPLLSITSTSGVKMAGYGVEPKIFCANTFNDDNLSSPDKFTFIIDASSLTLQVTSANKDGVKLGTHTASFNTKSVSIPIGGKEQSLGTVGVLSSQIEDNLSDGSYATTNQFDLRGNLVVYWKGYPASKYTIPIKFGDVSSYHNAKIEKGSTATTTFTGNDNDGDGILNSYDKCIDKPENYNGYQDGDGCPDTATTPTTTPTSSSPAPVTYSQCLSDNNHTWYVNSNFKETSYCGVKYSTPSGVCGFFDTLSKSCYVTLNKIDKTSWCVTLSDNSKMCITDAIFKSGGSCYLKDMDLCVWNKEKSLGSVSITGVTTGSGLSGKIYWYGLVKYTDNTTAEFLAKDDPSPFSFSIPLASLIGSVSGDAKEISQLTLNPILKFDNLELHKQITTKSSDIKYVATLNIKNQVVSIIPSSPLPDFTPTKGSNAVDGISLGNIIIRMTDVETKVPSTVVGINESADAQLNVGLIGTMSVDYNNGNIIKPIQIQLNPAVLSTGATFTGETNFIWTNLKVARGTSSHNGGTDDGGDVERCPIGQIGYMLNGVLICQEKGVIPTDDNDDGIIDDSSGGACAGLTPQQCLDQGKTNTDGGSNTSNGGMCPLDGGTGDSNGDGKICQICTDSSSGIGGFPCDEAYRNDYCDGTITCNDEPQIGDNTGGAVVVDDKNDGNSSDSCQVNTLSLANNACVIQTGDKPNTGSTNNICVGEYCSDSVTSDPNLIWYIAGGLVFIGFIALMIKRKR